MWRHLLMTAAALLLAPAVGQAEEDRAPAAAGKEAAAPVRAGKTTVTVIDENESVDDIVTRVRAGRTQEPRVREPPVGQKTDNPNPKAGGDSQPLRERIREAKAGGPERPEPRARERIRERLNERKTKAPRLEQREQRQQKLERLRNR